MRRIVPSRRVAIQVAAALVVLGACRVGAAEPDPLESLKQQFQKDPTRAFEHAARMFKKPQRAGDLEGMMGILRVVAPESRRLYYGAVLEDMIDAVIPVAQKSADWAALGEVYTERARFASHVLHDVAAMGGIGPASWLRYVRFLTLADEAYGNAGESTPGFERLRNTYNNNSWREHNQSYTDHELKQ